MGDPAGSDIQQGVTGFQMTEDANGETSVWKSIEEIAGLGYRRTDDVRCRRDTGKNVPGYPQTCPQPFLLVPGVGAQGGSLQEVAQYGMNDQCGLLVNSSRAIIYVDKSEKFASFAREAAQAVQREMAGYLHDKGIIPCKA